MDELKAKVLRGFSYRIGTGRGKTTTHMITGAGGVELYIDACRKEGLPDGAIASDIEVWIPEGESLKPGYYSLSILTVNKKSDEKTKG
jgi:hypothetical protein